MPPPPLAGLPLCRKARRHRSQRHRRHQQQENQSQGPALAAPRGGAPAMLQPRPAPQPAPVYGAPLMPYGAAPPLPPVTVSVPSVKEQFGPEKSTLACSSVMNRTVSVRQVRQVLPGTIENAAASPIPSHTYARTHTSSPVPAACQTAQPRDAGPGHSKTLECQKRPLIGPPRSRCHEGQSKLRITPYLPGSVWYK